MPDGPGYMARAMPFQLERATLKSFVNMTTPFKRRHHASIFHLIKALTISSAAPGMSFLIPRSDIDPALPPHPFFQETPAMTLLQLLVLLILTMHFVVFDRNPQLTLLLILRRFLDFEVFLNFLALKSQTLQYLTGSSNSTFDLNRL